MGRRTPERVTFGSVLAVGEFRALWAAELFSIAGDQLARVALAVLVYARTNSAGWTAATYALTFVPAFLGGVLLGGLGDRYPRRAVMVVSDLARAVLVALMALPGMPLALLCILVATMTFLGGPFKAAQQALLPAVLVNRATYTVGQSLRTVTSQAAQLVGFAGGGILVAAINPSVGLLLDAGTFLISAVILRIGVAPRAAVAATATAGGPRSTSLAALRASVRLVRRDPVLRTSFALSWLAGVYIAPEALAAPYAASLGAGAGAVGLLMASDPAGSLIGGYVWGRWVPDRLRDRIVRLLGVLAGVPLVLCVFSPGLVTSMALFAVTGMLVTAAVIHSNITYTLQLPDKYRAQGAGLFSSGLWTAQGLGALAAGGLADWIGPVPALVVAGAGGAVLAIPIAVAWKPARVANGQPNTV